MSDMYRLGILCKFYQNGDGTNWNAPTWNEVAIISDFVVDPQWERQDVQTRESRVKRGASTLVGMEFTGKILVRRSDASYGLFVDSFHAQTPMDILALDGPRTEAGSEGLRLMVDVIKLTDDQGPGIVRFRDFTLAPTLHVNVPQRAVVDGGGTLQLSTYAA